MTCYGCDVSIIWSLLPRSGSTRTARFARCVIAGIPTTVGLVPDPCAYAYASRHYPPPPVEVVLVVVGAAVLVVVVVVLLVVVVVVVVVQK